MSLLLPKPMPIGAGTPLLSAPWGRPFVCRAGVGLMLVAAVVLLGWQFDVVALRTVLPGANSMKPASALAFMLAGLALLNRCSVVPLQGLCRAASAVVATIGVASLLAHVLDVSLPSDHWYPDPESVSIGRIPGRMSQITAVGFTLLGVLGLLPDRSPWWRLQHGLALLVLAIAMFALASFAFQAGAQLERSDTTPVAIHTALLFVLAALAWLTTLPAKGLMRVVHAPSMGGMAARRLLLPALLLPSLLGLFARVAGDRLAWTQATVVSTLALLSAGALAGLIWWVALLLDRLERERAHAIALHDESHTDALTGLPNRRAFDEAIAGLVHSRRHADRSFALLMLDLDRFKDYNDTYGHLVGDEVLRQTAQLLRSALRPGDVPARYGGEEFAVLLPDTEAPEAARVAERIVQYFRVGSWPGRTVTVSIGTAAAGPAEATDDLVGRADTALYAAKAAGRNRVMMADAPVA